MELNDSTQHIGRRRRIGGHVTLKSSSVKSIVFNSETESEEEVVVELHRAEQPLKTFKQKSKAKQFLVRLPFPLVNKFQITTDTPLPSSKVKLQNFKRWSSLETLKPQSIIS